MITYKDSGVDIDAANSVKTEMKSILNNNDKKILNKYYQNIIFLKKMNKDNINIYIYLKMYIIYDYYIYKLLIPSHSY